MSEDPQLLGWEWEATPDGYRVGLYWTYREDDDPIPLPPQDEDEPAAVVWLGKNGDNAIESRAADLTWTDAALILHAADYLDREHQLSERSKPGGT